MGARRIQAQRRRSPSAAAGAEGPILGSGRQSVRGTGPRFALAVLLAVSVFNQIDRTILSILQVPLKRDLHLSDLQLGALTGLSFAAVYCAFTVPVSRLADRLPRTRLMAVALALWSLTTALSGLATTFAMLVLCRMGLALGESCCSPATLSLLSDYFPLKRRGVPIAIWTMSVPFGTMFGLIAGGWLSQSLGWRQAFVDVGAAGLALSPALLLLREPPRGRFDSPREPVPPTTLREAAAILWGSHAFRGMLLGGALWSFVFCAMQAWSAPFYVRIHGLPLATAGGWLAVVFGVGGGGGALLGGALTDRLSRRDAGVFGRIPAIGCLLAIPTALLQFLVPSVAVSLFAGFLSVLFLSLYLAPFSASTQSLVRPDMRALTSAVTLVFTNLIGLGLGPLFIGWASDVLAAHGLGDQGLRAALASVLAVAGLAAIAFLRAAPWMATELREPTAAPMA